MSTYPQPPKAHMRDYVEQILVYALALAPGFLLQPHVPEGSHVRWMPLLIGIVMGIPCGLLIALPFRFLIRNRSYRPFYVLIIVVYSMAWTGPLIVRYLNWSRDSSPHVERSLKVLELSRPSKGGNRITLQHWEPEEPPFTISGTQEPGTFVTLYTHEGAWGFEWIETVSDAYQNEHHVCNTSEGPPGPASGTNPLCGRP